MLEVANHNQSHYIEVTQRGGSSARKKCIVNVKPILNKQTNNQIKRNYKRVIIQLLSADTTIFLNHEETAL